MTENNVRNPLKCLNGTTLKILAMVLMLMDHAHGTIALRYEWLACAGRVAFPIFAFQLVEGYVHTKDYKKYLKRIFLFALISELPFNMMTGGGWIYPFHQNVMFTFCLALMILHRVDLAWQKGWKRGVVGTVLYGLLGYALGFVTFVDYYGYAVLTVLLFWLTRGRKFGWLAQLIAMAYINIEMIKGYSYILYFMGQEIWVPQQTFALLALIPIWMYNGQRGPGGKAMQYFGYAFYPAHILILVLLMLAGVRL